MERKKYVITGGPCTGKTTVIEILKKQGYQTIPEAARIVIGRAQRNGGHLLPWVDLEGFQKEVLKLQLELESKTRGGIVFLDRGLIDGIVYYKLNGKVPPQEFVEIAKESRYSKIFLLEQLDEYVTDDIRKEDRKTASRIQKLIMSTYQEFGYKPIIVPKLKPEERVDWIKRYIRQNEKVKL